MSLSISNKKISIIIPTFNEEKDISDCLDSLLKQDYINYEIIVVDDGSVDNTIKKIRSIRKIGSKKKCSIKIIRQVHKGSGEARNLGAKHAKGEILVFVDADMTFSPNFLRELVEPILKRKVIGTASQNELLANPDNYWAKCWNIGRFSAAKNYSSDYKVLITPKKSNYGTIFRAILKSEFEKVQGFETGGDYSDDESLAKKLDVKVLSVNNAVFYHKNPHNLKEVISRASWIGSDRHFRQNFREKVKNLVKFSLPVSIIKGLVIAWRFRYAPFILFKIIFDTTIWLSIINNI